MKQQIAYTRRNILKFAPDDIQKRIEGELANLSNQLDPIFSANKIRLTESNNELEELRVKSSKFSRDLLRVEKELSENLRKSELKDTQIAKERTDLISQIDKLNQDLRDSRRKGTNLENDLQRLQLQLSSKENMLKVFEKANGELFASVNTLQRKLSSAEHRATQSEQLLQRKETMITSSTEKPLP